MRACETSRDVEPHKQIGLSPLVASRRPRGAERNGLAWKPVAEDHRTGVEGIEGVMSLWGTRGAKGLWGHSCGSSSRYLAPRRGVAFASERKQPGALRQT